MPAEKQEDIIAALRERLAELEQLTETLSRGKYMWESTFDAIGDPVLIIGDDFSIQRANRTSAELAHQDIRNMIGKKCYEAFAGRQGPCPLCPLQETLQQEAPRESRITPLREDRDFQVSSYPYLGDGRSRPAVVHHYRDITEEKRLQRQLIQNEKMASLGLLAGGVAHEINNPLGGILAFAQLIMRDLDADSPLRQDLTEIESAALRCKGIVENLLDFSRQSRDSEQQSVSVNLMIDKILPLIRLRLRSQRIELNTDFDNSDPHVLGSPTQLQQVVLNMLTNAAQAIEQDGTISIRTEADSSLKKVRLTFKDDGCGIPQKSLDRIFDPYFTTKDQGQGTGLGLSICYSIISDHHGQIDVESEEGRGTRFRIDLPLLDREGSVEQRQAHSPN